MHGCVCMCMCYACMCVWLSVRMTPGAQTGVVARWPMRTMCPVAMCWLHAFAYMGCMQDREKKSHDSAIYSLFAFIGDLLSQGCLFSYTQRTHDEHA
ncbi:hypothetical protein EDD21DRAFT_122943 [Dissophora ornata]|nr:hypothetical protein EDD21DRAFT_122943 [Dissophora ornata]